MAGLCAVGPFNYNLIQMDDYRADSCAISRIRLSCFHQISLVSLVPRYPGTKFTYNLSKLPMQT